MRKTLIVIFLGAGAMSLFAQTPPSSVSETGKTSATQVSPAKNQRLSLKTLSTESVSPDAAVITLDGVCASPNAAGKKTSCKMVITRAQLESVADAARSEQTHSQFATTYARLLATSAEAEQKHLDKDPAVVKELQARMKLLRMQVLSEALYRDFEEQADKVSSSAIEKYYADNAPSYEIVNLERVSVPKTARSASGVTVDPAEARTKVDEMRVRAVGGEDCAELQMVAYKELGLNPAGAPSTKLDNVRRARLSPTELKVIDLKPGQISEVQETAEALYFLKVVSTGKDPLESVEPEIKATLRQKRLQEELQGASAKVKGEFNLTYLEAVSAPELFPAPATKQMSAAAGKPVDPRWRAMRQRRSAMPSTIPPTKPVAHTAPTGQPTR